MNRTLLFSLAAIAAIASHGALAVNAAAGNPLVGGGVTTDSRGATVRPAFVKPSGSQTLKKAGAVRSTSCADPVGYAPVTWTTFDRWGSFPIVRPADVSGEVRYCVALRLDNSPSFSVKYDVIGN